MVLWCGIDGLRCGGAVVCVCWGCCFFEVFLGGAQLPFGTASCQSTGPLHFDSLSKWVSPSPLSLRFGLRRPIELSKGAPSQSQP